MSALGLSAVVLLLTAAPAPSATRSAESLFAVRAVLEAFYGPPYTPAQRDDLVRFLGTQGFNRYIYGPKNDRQHRARWFEPYPPAMMAEFRRTVQLARNHGVAFEYALSATADFGYGSEEDFRRFTSKLEAFRSIGVRSFSLFFDDMSAEFTRAEDRERYRTFAEAHADFANRVRAWLASKDSRLRLTVCPTDYHGRAPFSPYLQELGERLHPDIDVFYTGPEVVSPTLTRADADDFAKALRRKPLLWDNYPVNDLAMRPELHVGPVVGRAADLAQGTRGIAINLMLQPEASKIALRTWADYLRAPEAYVPEASWRRALHAAAAPHHVELERFAENSLGSALNTDAAPRLRVLVEAAVRALRQGSPPSGSPELERLAAYLDELDAAAYVLKTRMRRDTLRQDLLPWLEALEQWTWVGKRAVEVLRQLEKGAPHERSLRWMNETLSEARANDERMTGDALVPLVALVHERVEKAKAPADSSTR